MVFASTDLKVDNSSLTGESEPQERFPLPDGSKTRPVEAENLVDFFLRLLTDRGCLFNIPIGFQFHACGQRRRLGRQVTFRARNLYHI
jgi:magnesium-transporting ATPase (P-type)